MVSWPDFRPLYTLMCKRAEDRAAFDSEQQNDPLVGDAAPFAEAMQFWSELPPGLIFFGACDPSLGKAGAGRDPSALLVGGLDRESMRLYVVAADIKKRHPDRIIHDLIALQRQWHCVLWAVEAVQFQEFFAEVLVREAARQGLPLPVSPVKNCTDKNLRIESLHPYFCVLTSAPWWTSCGISPWPTMTTARTLWRCSGVPPRRATSPCGTPSCACRVPAPPSRAPRRMMTLCPMTR